ncbi:MAG: hypothetical protein NC408_03750 [Candidatus Gastranaerophilales bacterium]|nr:hypothetical protein [Candidatus Gastranaerophilales bacterium]MCM1073870.1 hypothetical protein [Bacteroides sp.]
MKKIILLFIILLFPTSVFAKNIKVEAMSDFSTETPPRVWSVKVVEGFTTNGYPVYAGSIIKGRIENVKDPKRLKRNATFTFVPTDYFDYNTQKWFKVEQNIQAKYSNLSDVDAKSVAKTGAVVVGNKLLDGFFGPGVALVEGAVKNEQGNRAKSAVVSVYESTPLSYANKGKELVIEQGKVFVMNFKMPED